MFDPPRSACSGKTDVLARPFSETTGSPQTPQKPCFYKLLSGVAKLFVNIMVFMAFYGFLVVFEGMLFGKPVFIERRQDGLEEVKRMI